MDNGTENKVNFKKLFFGAIAIGLVSLVIGLIFNSVYKDKIPLDYNKLMTQKDISAYKPFQSQSSVPDDDKTRIQIGKQDNPDPINKIECEYLPLDFIEDLEEYFDITEYTLIDTREEANFQREHFKDSINIDKDKTHTVFRKIENTLDRDGYYVIYCEEDCSSGEETAQLFCENGFKDGHIFVFVNGYEELKSLEIFELVTIE